MLSRQATIACIAALALTACSMFEKPDDEWTFMFHVAAHDEVMRPFGKDEEPRETIIFYGRDGERYYAFRGDPGMNGTVAYCDNKGESYGLLLFHHAAWPGMVTLVRNSLQGRLLLTCKEVETTTKDDEGISKPFTYHQFGFLIPNTEQAEE